VLHLMAENLNEMLTKSLDEFDAYVNGFTKNEEAEKEAISKAQTDEDLSPDDVSKDTPSEDDEQESAPEQAPEEDGAPDDSQSADTDEDSEGEEDNDEDEEVEKSLASELNSNDSVRKALEVSEFLDTLVKGLDTVLTERTDKISKSIQESHQESNSMLAKSIIGIAKGQRAVLETNAELLKSVRAMNTRMNELESQPLVRKSVSNSAQVVEKSFKASAGEVSPKQTLTKSQASAKLMESFEGGNSAVLNDILALDGTGNLNSISDAGKQVLGLLQ